MRWCWIIFCCIATAFGQYHYVPAQILIPTLNGTHYVQNNTVYNNSATNQAGHPAHLILGNVQHIDRLLFNQEYFKTGRFYSSREKIIEYPNDQPTGYNRHETINAIKVFNKFYDGASARATIIKGGIGMPYVKIKLESKFRKGFRFLVQIYGH